MVKSTFISIIIPIILFYIILLYYRKANNEITYFKSDINNKTYRVRNLEDKGAASNTLASLSIKLKGFVNDFYKKNPNDAGAKRLFERFDENKVYEAKRSAKYTTYTVSKTDVHFCLRDKKNEKIHDMNLLMFVGLHELSHMYIKNFNPNHDAEFNRVFTHVLKHAVELGYYKPVDYKKKPVMYCGTPVEDTPLSTS